MKKYLVLSTLLLTVVLIGRAQSPAATQSKVVGPEKGALVIIGGGAITPDIWNRFVELAGGNAAEYLNPSFLTI
jgi:cyanophycinase